MVLFVPIYMMCLITLEAEKVSVLLSQEISNRIKYAEGRMGVLVCKHIVGWTWQLYEARREY